MQKYQRCAWTPFENDLQILHILLYQNTANYVLNAMSDGSLFLIDASLRCFPLVLPTGSGRAVPVAYELLHSVSSHFTAAAT